MDLKAESPTTARMPRRDPPLVARGSGAGVAKSGGAALCMVWAVSAQWPGLDGSVIR